MKKVKIITIVLAIILVTLVAFGGVYIKTQNRMENKVKEYDLGRELKGGRIIEIKVASGSDENQKNKEEDLTVENYNIVKKTIEKRLKSLGATDYTISLNEENGDIRVELPENSETDLYAYFITADGKVQIKEKDTENELLSDSMVEKTKFSYTSDADGKYQVFMEVYLTEEGQAKIDEIKNNYAIFASEIKEIEDAEKKENEDKEAIEGEETEKTKTDETEKTETRKIAELTIAGNKYDVDKIEKNKIRVNIGSATSNTTYVNNYINTATEIALLVNSGKYPLEYEIQGNSFVYSDITNEKIMYFEITVAIIMVIVFVVFVIKYKTNGLLASISYIGFLSLFLLVLRYTNVMISIEGITGIILVLIIDFIINEIMLREMKNIDYKGLLLKLIPIAIITIVSCFAKIADLSSFGMVMFWGLVLMVVYNFTVTKTLLKLKENK